MRFATLYASVLVAKDAIGRLWAAKSSGKCIYATVYMSDGGLDVKGQLDKLFGGIK